jgi:hypothetical protein
MWLGEYGTLRLLSHLPEATLVMEYWASQMSTAVKKLNGREKPHQEFIEIDHMTVYLRRMRPWNTFTGLSEAFCIEMMYGRR